MHHGAFRLPRAFEQAAEAEIVERILWNMAFVEQVRGAYREGGEREDVVPVVMEDVVESCCVARSQEAKKQVGNHMARDVLFAFEPE